MDRLRSLAGRLALPLAVYLVAAAVYVAMLGDRRLETSPDNHYAHLAASFLAGRLDQGGDPPGTNDWACYDRVEHGACPNGQFRLAAVEPQRYRWYVSFPPFPAVVMLPAVAAFGVGLPDRLFFAVLAGLGPATLFVLLRTLRERGHSERSLAEDLFLTVLFAFGSVFFFVAEQGTVWFAAHVVFVPLLCLFLDASIDARRPGLAGALLGMMFLTRPTTLIFGLFFAAEAARIARRTGARAAGADADWLPRLAAFVAGTDARAFLRRSLPFALPVLVAGGLAAWMNQARFENPFEFGHEYLQIVWRARIEKWGLFSYHYVGRNLAIVLASLPWLSREAPHLVVSGHGLALWVTTPHVLYALYPKRMPAILVALTVPTALVFVADLMYQNSGWIQFGYRFSLDYLAAVFAMIALGGRRFGWEAKLLAVFAIALNAFGAATFDRAPAYYHIDGTQRILFQPD